MDCDFAPPLFPENGADASGLQPELDRALLPSKLDCTRREFAFAAHSATENAVEIRPDPSEIRDILERRSNLIAKGDTCFDAGQPMAPSDFPL